MPDPQFETNRMLQRISGMLEGFNDLQDRLRQTQGTAEAADGKVKVTVGPTGALMDLQIDPRAMRLGSEALREHILAAVQEATARVAEEISGAVGRFTGEDGSRFGAAAIGKNLDIFGARMTDVRLPNTGDPIRDAQEIINTTLRSTKP